MKNIKVHDTAFIIAHYRSQFELLSKDPYAKLWLRPSLKKFAGSFAEHVSYHDEMLHCMRNRHFHDALQEISQQSDDFLFINIGAGFSMYPYTLPEKATTIEIDLPEIIAYKDLHTKKFTTQNKLPKRAVIHKTVDITDIEQLKNFKSVLKKYSEKKKVILIEGVFFFLKKDEIKNLLSFCKSIQKEGDILFCVSFDEEILKTLVFKRLTSYFSLHLKSKGNPYTVLPHSFYETLNGYKLIDKNSTLSLGKKLNAIDESLKEEDVLNEYLYTLERL
jgi:O-methyltransferase involved in polyketide biosynthesis